MIGDLIAGLLGKVIDRAWPDPAQRAQAAIELEKLRQAGEFKELDSAMQVILAEANSQDPWTSRARPSFMYVFYFILLALVIVAPVLGIFNPNEMKSFFENVKYGFEAVPEALWWTFSAGYLGYTTARTYEKKVGIAK
jgi:hypothetical protein